MSLAMSGLATISGLIYCNNLRPLHKPYTYGMDAHINTTDERVRATAFVRLEVNETPQNDQLYYIYGKFSLLTPDIELGEGFDMIRESYDFLIEPLTVRFLTMKLTPS